MITDETIQRIKQFTENRDWDQFHTPVNLAKSISIEASELLECFQWSDTDFNREHVCEELADVMNYCIQMADKLDVDLDQIINNKIEQNEKKYPVEAAKGSAAKYTELKK
jgi:NTP pyrophosphatase (non-canonical NTP hydrolase)